MPVLKFIRGVTVAAGPYILFYGSFVILFLLAIAKKQAVHTEWIDELFKYFGYAIYAVMFILFGGWLVIAVLWAGLSTARDRVRSILVRCPHGVREGWKQNRCPDCASEQSRRVEAAALDREFERKRAELERRAQALKKTEIERLATIIVPSLDELRGLPPYEFETVMAAMFRRLGYEVTQTPASNDLGRDGILRKGGKTLLFECKRYKEGGVSGRPDLQKFHSAIVTDNADGGYFITTGGFSAQAVEFASQLKERKIVLITPPRLLKMLYRSAAGQQGNPIYRTACKACGVVVSHQLYSPAPVRCPNGHQTPPSIAPDEVMSHLTVPLRARRSRRQSRYRR